MQPVTILVTIKTMQNTRGQLKKALSGALPFLLFVAIMTAMTGAAEGTGEREIIFPEAGAIALGALVAPRLAWRTDKAGIFLSICLCACLGVVLVRWVPLPLAWQLALAFFLGQVVLLATRTTFAPLISAIVLPVLLQTRTPVYPAAACVLTLLILAAATALERTGIRRHAPFRCLPPPSRSDLSALILRTLSVCVLCLIAVKTENRFLVCPPLLVAFTEFSRQGNVAVKSPLRTTALLASCAAIGALCRALVCGVLLLPLTVAAIVTAALLLLLVRWQRFYLPPAAALAMLALLVPETALPIDPLQILCGAAVFVLLAQVLFQRGRLQSILSRSPARR